MLSKFMDAKTICFKLFSQEARAAASRTFCTAGTSKPIRMAMIAITTNNSISVNPFRCEIRVMKASLHRDSSKSDNKSDALAAPVETHFKGYLHKKPESKK